MRINLAQFRLTSLRSKILAAAAVLSFLALSNAAVAIWGLTMTESRASAALAAQNRLEAWANLSTKINEWLLLAFRQGEAPPQDTISAALLKLEELVAQDLAEAGAGPTAQMMMGEARHPAQIRAYMRQLGATDFSKPQAEAAVAFYMAQAPSLISARIEHERRRREAALSDMDGLRTPLRLGAIGLGLATPLIMFLLWKTLFRRLLLRLNETAKHAQDVVSGKNLPQKNGPNSHIETRDEFALMLAKLRQTAARLERKRHALSQDLTRLESLIQDRTSALQAANDSLAATDASRKRFFMDVSHELRTPLTVIMGEAELGTLCPDPKIRASFQTIEARAQRLFRRIEDLLRIARSEDGTLDLNLTDVPLADILDLAAADLAPLRLQAGQQLHIAIDRNLKLKGDRDWLRQVFAGLMENTIKYGTRGCNQLITARANSGRAEITFADNGANISAQICDDQPKAQSVSPAPPAITRFRRGGAKSQIPALSSGFGLGLSLAAWVVEASGGQLRSSPSDTGFRVDIDLPLSL